MKFKLDTCFAREVKKINGDGSREARFTFLNPARAAAKELSTPNVANIYGECIKKYGRVTVAICTAATIAERRDRLEFNTLQWANEVLKLWNNRPSDISCVAIRDNLHPTRIEEYARELIKITTECEGVSL